MLKELIANDRIVGGLTPEASARAKALYEIFCAAQIFSVGAPGLQSTAATSAAPRRCRVQIPGRFPKANARLGRCRITPSMPP
jgi:UDP-N-acetyl-D-mannosaminuronic acid dehydrogenase